MWITAFRLMIKINLCVYGTWYILFVLFELYEIIMLSTARVFQHGGERLPYIFNANDRQRPSDAYMRKCINVFAWLFFFCDYYNHWRDIGL